MTMQIALPARNGGMVFASDTKIRAMEAEPPGEEMTKNPVFGTIRRSKVSLSSKHDVVVGLAGGNAEDDDWAKDLADHFSEQSTLPESLKPFVETWGNGLFERISSPGSKQSDYPMCTLLVASPNSPYCCFAKVRVNRRSYSLESSEYLVNGNENLAAIFWLQYFKCDEQRYELPVASRIAAFTILMGHELNGNGIGGLEIWTYLSGWTRMPANQIENLNAEFQALKESMHSAVLR